MIGSLLSDHSYPAKANATYTVWQHFLSVNENKQ